MPPPKLTKADISGPSNFQHLDGAGIQAGTQKPIINKNDDLTPINESSLSPVRGIQLLTFFIKLKCLRT